MRKRISRCMLHEASSISLSSGYSPMSFHVFKFSFSIFHRIFHVFTRERFRSPFANGSILTCGGIFPASPRQVSSTVLPATPRRRGGARHLPKFELVEPRSLSKHTGRDFGRSCGGIPRSTRENVQPVRGNIACKLRLTIFSFELVRERSSRDARPPPASCSGRRARA